MLASEWIQLENQGVADDLHVNSPLICIRCNSAWKKEVVTKLIKRVATFLWGMPTLAKTLQHER